MRKQNIVTYRIAELSLSTTDNPGNDRDVASIIGECCTYYIKRGDDHISILPMEPHSNWLQKSETP